MKLRFKKAGELREGALLCVACSKQEILPAAESDAIAARLAERTEYRTLATHVLVFGLCPVCRPGAGEDGKESHE